MSTTPKRNTLNRPVFAQRAFDSTALTVLTTLLVRLTEAGSHTVTVRRGGSRVARLTVEVGTDGGDRQLDLDLAALGGGSDCGCSSEAGYRLDSGGVLAAYASRGTGRYSVSVSRAEGSKKGHTTLLDSAETVSEGGFFAVTLVRPGEYRVRCSAGRSEGLIRVRVPKEDEGYRPDRPTLVEIGKKGIYGKDAIELFSGQSVVFQCSVASRVQVELIAEDESAGEPIHRGRITRKVRRRRPSAGQSAV